MSSISFQLPTNCSFNLQQFCLEKSENEILSSLENNPQKLLNFFATACANSRWQKNNSELFQKLTDKIVFVEKSFNSEQIKKISEICIRTLTSPIENTIRESIVKVYWQTLSIEHALSMAANKELNHSSAVVKQCLAYLEEQIKQKKICRKDGKVEIKIKEINPEIDQILAAISKWEADKRDKIDIHLSPDKRISRENLDALAEKYGKYTDSLTLDGNVQNDEHLKRLSENFTQIHRLFIHSDKVSSLPQLPKPEKLTHLNCRWSKNLTKLPHQYFRLTYLNCVGCQKLIELPRQYTRLTSLYCGGCFQLARLPRQYIRLTRLECQWCVNLTKLPRQYTRLIYLDCQLCINLTKLPQQYTRLISLYCNGCDGLTELSKYKFLLNIYRLKPKNAKKIASSMNLSYMLKNLISSHSEVSGKKLCCTYGKGDDFRI